MLSVARQAIVSDLSQLDRLQDNITALSISSNTYNNYDILDLNRFGSLTTIIIGNNCCSSVQRFKIDGLNRLKTIKIGSNSFTQSRDGNQKNRWKSFHILNCKQLKSLEIGDNSFSDFAGDFQLSCLLSLQSIKIGFANAFSYCFYGSTFIVRGLLRGGNDDSADLPNLESIELGGQTFRESLSTVIESIESKGMR